MQIFPGTEGLVLRYTLGQNISGAEATAFNVRLPDTTEEQWPAVIRDSHTLEYMTQEGDLDQVGVYIVHPYVEFEDGFKGEGLPVTFKVTPRFKQ